MPSATPSSVPLPTPVLYFRGAVYECMNAIRYDKTQTFREKYRSIDVLLMDDIQFMAGKERTQEEFFQLPTRSTTGRSRSSSLRTAAGDSDAGREQLHSRFELHCQHPAADLLETKVAILKRKADLDGVSLPDDVAFFIASKVKSNIREFLKARWCGPIAISCAGYPSPRCLRRTPSATSPRTTSPAGITIEKQIQRAVGAHYKLRVDDLKSKNNSRQIAVPRQVAMYLCKRLTKHSFPEIRPKFVRHHTTVIHSVDKIERLLPRIRISTGW